MIKDHHVKMIKDYNLLKSVNAVSKLHNVSRPTVLAVLNKYNIPKHRLIRIKPVYEDKQIIGDYLRLKSTPKVAKIHKISQPTVLMILKRNNIQRQAQNDKHLKNIPQAIEAYKGGMPVNQITQKFGLTTNFFKRILKQNSLEFVNRNYFPVKGHGHIILANFDKITAAYKETPNVFEIARQFNVSHINLYAALKRKGILIDPKTRFCNISAENLPETVLKIYDAYVNEKLNMVEVSKKLNISRYCVRELLIRNYGIEILRSRAETRRLMNYKEEHQLKCMSGSFSYKKHKLPSGKIIQLQGYEPQFLDYVFDNGVLLESDFQFNKRPRIKLSDSNMVKAKHYYPDFYIPKYNLIVEIKSTYTLQRDLATTMLKENKTREVGYNFIMVMDKKYEKFDEYLRSLKQKYETNPKQKI